MSIASAATRPTARRSARRAPLAPARQATRKSTNQATNQGQSKPVDPFEGAFIDMTVFEGMGLLEMPAPAAQTFEDTPSAYWGDHDRLSLGVLADDCGPDTWGSWADETIGVPPTNISDGQPSESDNLRSALDAWMAAMDLAAQSRDEADELAAIDAELHANELLRQYCGAMHNGQGIGFEHEGEIFVGLNPADYYETSRGEMPSILRLTIA